MRDGIPKFCEKLLTINLVNHHLEKLWGTEILPNPRMTQAYFIVNINI